MLNPDTLVAVCGYAGDANQIKILLPYIAHHQCPIVVLSPEDSKITPAHLGHVPRETVFRSAGKRAYIGVDSLKRQILHLRELLKFPHRYFFVNDSDSVCLSPKLPSYLYEGNVVWSNEASDLMHTMPDGYAYPRYAGQPPYFMSRLCVEEIIKAGERDNLEAIRLGFIDHVMMKWVIDAGLSHSTFPKGVSCPTRDNPPGVAHMVDYISQGGTMLHAIKTRDVILTAANARLRYKKSNPGA